MRIAELTLSEDRCRAYVVLRPSWLARKLGARVRIVELYRRAVGERWRSSITDREITELQHGTMIRAALEERPVGAAAEIPFARVVSSRA